MDMPIVSGLWQSMREFSPWSCSLCHSRIFVSSWSPGNSLSSRFNGYPVQLYLLPANSLLPLLHLITTYF